MPDRLTGRTLVIATGHDLSLALLEERAVVAETRTPMSKGHAEALVPAIGALMAPFGGPAARCGRLIVETGPGSFTGLRVGLAAARALALAWGADLLGVRSTQLVAAQARRAGFAGSLLVALEAPRGQLWVEGFSAQGFASCRPPASLSPVAAARVALDFDSVAGTAMFLLRPGDAPMPPRAAAIEALASWHLTGAELLYVRSADEHAAAAGAD